MSLAASRWAWKACAGNAKVILLALAEHADQDGYCFPGLQRLASMCEVSESTAHRMIRLLAARKLISIEPRFNKNGSCRSNGYRLAIADRPVNLTGWDVSVTGGRCQRRQGGGVIGDTVTTTEPVLYKTPLQPAHGHAAAADLKRRARRGGTRLCFPKAISDAEREALEDQVADLTADNAQQILDELAGRMNTKRVRNPVGYCVGLVERLRRGTFLPVAGLEVAKQRQAKEREKSTLSDEVTTIRVSVNGAHHRLPENIRSSLERMRPKLPGEHDDDAPKSRD